MSIYLYEYMYAHYTFMNTFKRLCRFDLEIHEIGRQDLIVDGDVTSY
jgi:hypothetical protein